MLVNCPKCNFSQPKDQFCANCGIDMERFKPAGTPVWRKALASPFLYISLTFVVVFASIHYIREKQKEDLRARVEYLKGGPVLVERHQADSKQVEKNSLPASDPGPQEAQTQSDSFASTEEGSANSRKLDSQSSAEDGGVAPAASATATATPTPTTLTNASLDSESSPGKPARNEVHVIYAELDSATLNAWSDEMRASGQFRSFDEVTMGPVPQISQKLKSLPGIKIHQQLIKKFQPGGVNQANQTRWFVGTHRTADEENEMGFFHSLVIYESKEGTIRGELEVQRAFRDPKDPNNTMERVSYGGPFDLPAGTGYVMRGLLPRKFSTEIEMDSKADPFLTIFKSAPYLSGQNEFTLILDFDTSGSQQR